MSLNLFFRSFKDKTYFTLLGLVYLLSQFNLLFAQDISLLGGDLTSSFTDRNAIQLPAPNVASEERFQTQISGFSVFHRFIAPEEGLGPTFNHVSCGGCHENNGRGNVTFTNSIDGGASMVLKVSLPGLNPDGSPINVPGIGEQLQQNLLNGRSQFSLKLGWLPVPGKYPDGRKYTLRKPDIRFSIPGYSMRQIYHSLRMTPPVIGPGLLEAIPESTILSFSDISDANRDGISGRPQYTINKRTGTKMLGRFGFKASHSTLEEQSAAAAFNDMGVTSSLFNDGINPPELSDDALFRMVVYMGIAGTPGAQRQTDPKVIKGKELFFRIGCESCHKTNILTGPSDNPETSNQLIHPFTDLLLHDMGSGLADRRAEFEARGSEWRTTPLWGLGFSEKLSDVRARFLHDGRARTVEEAILWHGGEASRSRTRFKKLKRYDRSSLIAFLRSL